MTDNVQTPAQRPPRAPRTPTPGRLQSRLRCIASTDSFPTGREAPTFV